MMNVFRGTQEDWDRLRQNFADGLKGCFDVKVLNAFPAQELVGCSASIRKRWEQLEGHFYSGRMIALKSDPIWKKLSDFQLPYPPFISGDQTDILDVGRNITQEKALLQAGDIVQGPREFPAPDLVYEQPSAARRAQKRRYWKI